MCKWYLSVSIISSACTVLPESSMAFELETFISIMRHNHSFRNIVLSKQLWIKYRISLYYSSDANVYLLSSRFSFLVSDLPEIYDVELRLESASKGLSSWKFPISDRPNEIVNPSHRQNRFTINNVLKILNYILCYYNS